MNHNPSPRFLVLSLAALLAALAVPGLAVAEDPVRRIEQSFFAGQVRSVEVDLVVGSLDVEGTTGRNAEVELILRCDRTDTDACRRRANRIQLAPRISSDELSLRLKNTSRARVQGIQAEMRIKLPRDLSLEIDLAGGDVTVRGMRGDLEIDSAAGDVDIAFPQDRVAQVKVDVGVGEAELWLRDSRVEGRGFPRSITWNGSGTSEIEVDLAAGDVTVRLE